MQKHYLIAAIVISLTTLAPTVPPQRDLSGVIVKDYGVLKATGAVPGCRDIERPAREPEFYGLKTKCTIIYKGELDTKTYDRPMVGIDIFSFVDENFSRNHIMLRLFNPSIKDVRDQFKNQAGTMIIAEINDRSGLTENLYWVSNSAAVIFHVDDTEIPEELIRDYKKKYPPTVTFNASVLTAKSILKENLDLKFDIIYDLEPQREGKENARDKVAAYVAMRQQCYQEKDIYCLTDLSSEPEISCPITLTSEDKQREKLWNKLRSEAKPKEVNPEKVHRFRPARSRCDMDPQARGKIINILGMTYEDMLKVPPEY